MANDTNSPKALLKSMKIMHLALITGLVMFTLVSVVVTQMGFEPELAAYKDYALIGVAAFSLIIFMVSRIVFQKIVGRIDRNLSLTTRLIKYRTAIIIRFALYEGPAFLGIVTFMLTGDYLNLIITGLMIALLVSSRPGVENTASDLGIPVEDLL